MNRSTGIVELYSILARCTNDGGIIVIKHLIVVLLLFLNSFPSFAQQSEQFKMCKDKAKTQTEMNICADEEATRVTIELNDAHRKVLSKAANQPLAVAKIRAAER